MIQIALRDQKRWRRRIITPSGFMDEVETALERGAGLDQSFLNRMKLDPEQVGFIGSLQKSCLRLRVSQPQCEKDMLICSFQWLSPPDCIDLSVPTSSSCRRHCRLEQVDQPDQVVGGHVQGPNWHEPLRRSEPAHLSTSRHASTLVPGQC